MDHFNKSNTFYFLYFFFIAILISEAKKAQKMCKKYTKQACNPASSWRIVSGRSAKAMEYPHMALLGVDNYFEDSGILWTCGGSLISKNFVMSAAHCTAQNPVRIRLGELNWNSTINGTNPTDYEITETIVHPNFDGVTLMNDIALFRFQGLSTFNDYIRPICLNLDENIPKQKYTAVGWGAAEYGGSLVPMLQSVNLDRQDDAICNEIYEADKYDARSMLCVGYAPGGRDTCTGDSGGPLQIINEATKCTRVPIYTQIGIVSGGEDCALPNTPAKYTKVSYFIPWIEKIVWHEAPEPQIKKT